MNLRTENKDKGNRQKNRILVFQNSNLQTKITFYRSKVITQQILPVYKILVFSPK